MVSKSAKYYQEHPLARKRKPCTIANLRVLHLKKRKEGNSQNITLFTIRGMGQLLARAWMLVIHVQELGISHHR